MFIDGLWLSGITLYVERSGLPIPDEMKGLRIRVPLSQTQVNAVCTLLGFGMRNGDFLMYKDDDLDKMISDPENNTFITEYRNLGSGLKMNRRTINVFTPIVNTNNNVEWHLNDRIIASDSEMRADPHDNYIKPSSDDKHDVAHADFSSEDLKNLNIKRAIHGS